MTMQLTKQYLLGEKYFFINVHISGKITTTKKPSSDYALYIYILILLEQLS